MAMIEVSLDNYGAGHVLTEGHPGLAPAGVPLLTLLSPESALAPSLQPVPEAAERDDEHHRQKELELERLRQEELELERRRLRAQQIRADIILAREVAVVAGYERGTTEAEVAAQAIGRLFEPHATHRGAADRETTMNALVARITAGHRLTQEGS